MMEQIWIVEKTFDDLRGDVFEYYIERDGRLKPIEFNEERINRALIHQGHRDPYDTFVWSNPAERTFRVLEIKGDEWFNADGQNITIAGETLPRESIESVEYEHLDEGSFIKAALNFRDGTKRIIAKRDLAPALMIPGFNDYDLDFHSGWAQFLVKDLSSYLGVFIKDTGSGQDRYFINNRSLLDDEHPLYEQCRNAGSIRKNHYRVTSDLKTVGFATFDNFPAAKKYCDRMVRSYSADTPLLSVVYDHCYNAVYLGKM